MSDDAELDMDAILDLAEDALDRGDPSNAIAFCNQVLDVEPAHSGALFLTGEALRDLFRPDAAELAFRAALRAESEHAPAWAGLAGVLFETLDLTGALHASTRAIRLSPDDPDGWWWRGLVRERMGDMNGADRDLRRASMRDPVAFPWAVLLTDAMVKAIVQTAVESMHPSIQAYLTQVTILLEEIPSLDVLQDFEPSPPGHELLGFFSGYSLHDRSLDNPWTSLPSAIVLFRRNLQRYASDRDMLIEELRVTVLHEVGHFLGLDEDDLEARGLD